MSTSSANPSRSSLHRRAPLLAGAAVLAGIALAVAAVRHAPATEQSPIDPSGSWLNAYRLGLAIAFAGYVAALVVLRRRPAGRWAVVAVAAAIQLAPLAAPLLLSKDVYAYWNKGRIAAVHHANVFSTRPTRFPHDPSFRLVAADWREKPTFYGPTFAGVATAHAALVGDSRRAAVAGYRVLAAASVVGAAALAAVLAPAPALGAAVVGWNPLLALHFGGGGHHDALMMALFLAALLLYAGGRRWPWALLWVAAIAVKWVLLVVVPLQLLARRAVDPVRAAVVAAAAAALCFALFGSAWLHSISQLRSQGRMISSTSFAWWLGDHTPVSREAWRVAIAASFAVAYAALAWQAWRRREARLGLTTGLLVASISFLGPWYVMWPAALAAVEDDPAARWVVVGLTAWLLRDAVPL